MAARGSLRGSGEVNFGERCLSISKRGSAVCGRKRRATSGAARARSVTLVSGCTGGGGSLDRRAAVGGCTVAARGLLVKGGANDEHGVDDRDNAFAGYVDAVFAAEGEMGKYGGFVAAHDLCPLSLEVVGLARHKVLEGRVADDIAGDVLKDFGDGVRGVQNGGAW